ncbi:MAG: hypothetical protein Q7O66_12245 [Dehalococcoidia bacterium]|nr:hypothetical protein [Dehalococcoidia bacterium]
MLLFLRQFKAAFATAGAFMLGPGRLGYGFSPSGPRDPCPRRRGYMFIALASPPAGLMVLLLAAPLSQFAHLDISLGGGVPEAK